MSKTILDITGMSCGHCLNAVNKALSSVPGLRAISVQIGRAEVEVPDQSALDLARTAIESAGYKVASAITRT